LDDILVPIATKELFLDSTDSSNGKLEGGEEAKENKSTAPDVT